MAGYRAIPGLLAALLAAASATPDEVFLRGGGRVSGVIVERTKETVALETGPGRVTLPLSRVEKILESRSNLQAYHERESDLAAHDVEGWAALARWAAERDLVTQSRQAWQRVLAINPSHPEANAALGRVELDGAWMGADEAYRARGYVQFEGRWVTPAEHEARVREQAVEEASERDRREAELRVREAEARAREAEARAREAEAAAQPVTSGDGIPLWWGWGGGVLLPPAPPEHSRRHHRAQAPAGHPGPPSPSGPPPAPTQPSARPQPAPAKPAAIEPPPLRSPRRD
jgi:hypothetical protein